MREVKFRAWEKHLKEIIPVHDIDFEKKMINTSSAWRFFDEIELMQYTGLKDKNDKEIYEDDILFDPVTNQKYIVAYDDAYAMFFMKNVSDDVALPDYDFGEFDIDEGRDLYIIGNIYENPELLEAT